MSGANGEDPRFRRDLSDEEREHVDAARRKAFTLYEGKTVPHRSCGIALAETFGLATASYQALRKGGITGAGECGAIKAGELVLGELLGDPDPTAAVTGDLRAAATWYRDAWRERVDLGEGGAGGSIVCNDLTSTFEDFTGSARQRFCTNIAAEVAAVVAEALVRLGVPVDITPVAEGESPAGEVVG